MRPVGELGRAGIAVVVILGSLLSVARVASAAPTRGPGTMVVSPTLVLAGSTGNDLTFTYTASPAGMDQGSVTIGVAKGWTAPQSRDSSGPGYVSTTAGSIRTAKAKISIGKLTLCGGCALTVTYADAAAPLTARDSTFVAGAAASGKKAKRLAAVPAVTVATLPSAPEITSVTPGNEQLTVAFTPATASPAVSSYTVSCGSQSAGSRAAEAVTVSGLTNGVSTPCTVYATNPAGNGPEGNPVSGTPEPQVPGTTTVETVSPGDDELLVSVSTADANGSPVTSYTANCGSQSTTVDLPDPGETEEPGDITVSGLSDGSQYSCTAFASNAIGNGPVSPPVTGTPAPQRPNAPSYDSIVPGNGSLTINYEAAFSFNTPIISYTASCGSDSTTVGGSTLSATVSGLTVDGTYGCSLYATDSVGNSQSSGWGGQAGVPDAPTISSVLAQDGQLTLEYGATGTSTSRYTATCGTQSVTVNGNTTWATVSGLSDGVDYSCTVFASNAAGSGPASAPSPGTPSPTESAVTASAGGFFSAVSCPSTTECVAVGAGGSSDSSGLVELSTDGGNSFSDEPVPAGTPPLEAVSCFDGSHCVAVGGSTVLVSSDGGTSWASEFAEQDLSVVSCLSDLVCLAGGAKDSSPGGWSGAPIFSADGGVTWQESLGTQASLGFEALGSMGCTSDVCVGVGPGPQPLLSSSDEGQSWLGFGVPGGIFGEANAVSCLPTTTTCVIVGDNAQGNPGNQGPSAPALAFLSTDDGANWTNVSSSFPAGTAFMSDVACPTSTTCYAFGGPTATGGPLVGAVSSDGGETWGPVVGPTGVTAPLGLDVQNLSCASASTCMVVGENGSGPAAAFTTDSGSSWSLAASIG